MPPVTGYTQWFKADAGTFQDTGFTTPATTNGDPVGGWQDQSGNGYHWTQSTNANRPTFTTSVAQGLPGISQGNNNLVFGTLAFNTTAATLYIAAQPITPNAGANNRFFSLTDGTNADFNQPQCFIGLFEDATGKFTPYSNGVAGVDMTETSGSPFLYALTISTAMDQYLGSRSTHFGPTSLSPGLQGQASSYSAPAHLAGNIPSLAAVCYMLEVILYPTVHSSADLDTNFAYLSRWTTAASGKPTIYYATQRQQAI